LWSIFEATRAALRDRKLVTWADIFGSLTEASESGWKPPFEFAVVDECQDLDVAQARFLAAVAGSRKDGLFFAGDLGQQIFQQPFSWKALGLDVRGRSTTLRINYRISHQIRTHGDRLLPSIVSDVDGNSEGRLGTVSMFDGPPPLVMACTDADHECRVIGNWISERLK
jgi:superfamily I DNA/RNA helicase